MESLHKQDWYPWSLYDLYHRLDLVVTPLVTVWLGGLTCSYNTVLFCCLSLKSCSIILNLCLTQMYVTINVMTVAMVRVRIKVSTNVIATATSVGNDESN